MNAPPPPDVHRDVCALIMCVLSDIVIQMNLKTTDEQQLLHEIVGVSELPYMTTIELHTTLQHLFALNYAVYILHTPESFQVALDRVGDALVRRLEYTHQRKYPFLIYPRPHDDTP